MIFRIHIFVFLFCFTILVLSAAAEEVRIAVATNFSVTLKEVVRKFSQDTGHTAVIISGSTGKLYAQIKHGAPFDVFFSADVKRPHLLEKEGLAIQGSRFALSLIHI